MASLVTTQGSENTGKLLAGVSGSTVVACMSFDNSTGAAKLSASHTAANSGAAVGAFIAKNTTNTTLADRSIQFEGSLTTGEFNGNNIGRILLHHGTSATVTSASNTLFGGFDDQLFGKTAAFSLTFRATLQHRST